MKYQHQYAQAQLAPLARPVQDCLPQEAERPAFAARCRRQERPALAQQAAEDGERLARLGDGPSAGREVPVFGLERQGLYAVVPRVFGCQVAVALCAPGALTSPAVGLAAAGAARIERVVRAERAARPQAAEERVWDARPVADQQASLAPPPV